MQKIKINWSKFLSAQIELDKQILQSNNLSYNSTNQSRKLALIVELNELINETKVFKFWSKSQPNKEKLLMEYIDLFHFTLSLSIDYDLKEKDFYFLKDAEKKDKQFLLEFFLEIQSNICSLLTKSKFISWIENFWKIGNYLGLSYEDIEEAYFKKLKINYERQENNY